MEFLPLISREVGRSNDCRYTLSGRGIQKEGELPVRAISHEMKHAIACKI